MGNLHFVHPQYFALLAVLPLLGWQWYRNQRRHYPDLQFSQLAPALVSGSWRGWLRQALPLLRLLALALIVVALARPQRGLTEEKVTAEGIDIVLALDLSSSMLAQDFRPDRLEVAKKLAGEFVAQRRFDRIGLVVFAGEAFSQCPLTTDHTVLQSFLAQLECGLLEDGTAIGMGMTAAINRLKDSPTKTKVIILVTDGVNNVGYIKPITAGEIARKLGIKVYAIGVGSMGEALSPISRKSDGTFIFGLVKVEIDEPLLREVAKMTGGKYFRATNANDLRDIYRQIDQLEKTKIEVAAYQRYREEFHHWVLAAIALLTLEFLLRFWLVRSFP